MPADQQGQRVAEEIWLNYFNRVLYSSGLISEKERNCMAGLIAARKPFAGKKLLII